MKDEMYADATRVGDPAWQRGDSFWSLVDDDEQKKVKDIVSDSVQDKGGVFRLYRSLSRVNVTSGARTSDHVFPSSRGVWAHHGLRACPLRWEHVSLNPGE